MTQQNFTVDYGLTLNNANITATTPNNPGSINWSGNSSGDGSGATTMKLVPDDTLVGNDQYLVIDPTEPTHIHIRAGGTIDNSSAQLYLGGENNYVRVQDGSGVRLYNETRSDDFSYFSDPEDFNTASWYESDGTYFVEFTAVNAEMGTLAFEFGDDNDNRVTVTYGDSETSILTYGGSTSNLGSDVYRFSVVEAPPVSPTALGAIEFEIWSTNDNSVSLSNNDFTVEVEDDVRITGNDTFSLRNRSNNDSITIRTDYDGADRTWEFAANGTLTTPGDIVVVGDITGTSAAGTLVFRAEPGSNTALQLNDSVDSEIRTVANLEIRTDISDTGQTWIFDTTGNLTAPGNITANSFIGDGSQLTDITAAASPGGSNGDIQFNNNGALAGSNLLTIDSEAGTVSAITINTPGLTALNDLTLLATNGCVIVQPTSGSVVFEAVSGFTQLDVKKGNSAGGNATVQVFGANGSVALSSGSNPSYGITLNGENAAISTTGPLLVGEYAGSESAGSPGQVLTSGGAGNAMSWTTVGGGSGNSLVNGEYTVILESTGVLTLEDGTTIQVGEISEPSSITYDSENGFLGWSYSEGLSLSATPETAAYTAIANMSGGTVLTLVPDEGESFSVTVIDGGEFIEGTRTFIIEGFESPYTTGSSIIAGTTAPPYLTISNSTVTFENVTGSSVALEVSGNGAVTLGKDSDYPGSGLGIQVRNPADPTSFVKIHNPEDGGESGITLSQGNGFGRINAVDSGAYSVGIRNYLTVSPLGAGLSTYDVNFLRDVNTFQVTVDTTITSTTSYAFDTYSNQTLLISGHPSITRNITWDTNIFVAIGVTLPTTIAAGKTIIVIGLFDSANLKCYVYNVSIQD